MPTRSVVRVEVDDELKAEAAAMLDTIGLSAADAVRILFHRIAKDQSFPLGPVEPPAR